MVRKGDFLHITNTKDGSQHIVEAITDLLPEGMIGLQSKLYQTNNSWKRLEGRWHETVKITKNIITFKYGNEYTYKTISRHKLNALLI